MNIAYVHTGLWPSNSPSITFITYNAIGLCNSFKNCDLYIKKNFENDLEQIFTKKFAVQKPENLNIRYPKFRFVNKTNFFYFREIESKIIKSAQREGLHGIITRTPKFLPFLVRLKERLKVPVFYETHDFYSDLTIRTDLNNKNRFKQFYLEKKYIPEIDGVFCLQEPQIEFYRKIYPDQRYYLLRTGIHRIYEHPVEKRKYVAYIGSLDYHKGVEVLLHAMQSSETKPHLLLIGGKNDQEISALRSEIERVYDPELVTITGWVDKEKLHRYLAVTALGIIPLRDTFFNRYLTSPLKLFDYYSFGIPVIASDLPTTRALIEEYKTGFFFKNNDAADLAVKIDILMNDPEQLSRMSKNVYREAAHYLWRHRADRIREIVTEFYKTDTI